MWLKTGKILDFIRGQRQTPTTLKRRGSLRKSAQAAENVAQGRVGGGQAVGRVNTNIEPWLSSLSARIEPRWARTMCLTMARPRPVPPDSRERALSMR